MKPGDIIMIVYSLGAEGNRTATCVSGVSFSRERHQDRIGVRVSGTATNKTARARWPERTVPIDRMVLSGPAVRNRWGESVFVVSG